MINKAVVGSGHGDACKYVGEGVVLCSTPSTPGVPLLQCSCLSMAVLGNFVICDVTALHVHWSHDLLL